MFCRSARDSFIGVDFYKLPIGMLQDELFIIVLLKFIGSFLTEIISSNSDVDRNTLMNIGIVEIDLLLCRIDDIWFSPIRVSLMYFLTFCLVGCFLC